MASSDDLKRGDRIGKWVIRERIGVGGMGTVYRAVDTRLHREVALKMVVPERVAEVSDVPAAEILDRFRREAQAVARVKHPNVLEIISYEVVDGRSIIEMELLEGETLGKLLRKGALGVERSLEILIPVCAAVAACHERGIIHRDIKPGNIFLAEREGRRAGDRRKVEVIKVLDFGVSKVTLANELTQARRLLGTPNYMAPEQVRGQADERSDQYSIAVLLYHCLTGRPPYAELREKPQAALLVAVQTGNFPRPRELRPELPDELEAVILRAMSLEPASRFGSVDELGRRLVPFAAPVVANEWSEYFLESTPRFVDSGTSLPNSLISGGGSTIKDLVEIEERVSAPSAPATMNERDIATAADARFSATTALAPPVPSTPPTKDPSGPAPAAAVDEGDSNPEPGQTPWSVADVGPASKTELVGQRRRLLRAGLAAGALALAVTTLLVTSSKPPAPARSPASAASLPPPAAVPPAALEPAFSPPAAVAPSPAPAQSEPVRAASDAPRASPSDVPASKEPARRKVRRKARSSAKPAGPETGPDGVIILP